mmetsp:Transcript_18962/g.38319  ORF Transcript_18962/g.38319 Transcript_18962/m.38319 type:complete len:261 (+) Transcript_18962:248-1030(+)
MFVEKWCYTTDKALSEATLSDLESLDIPPVLRKKIQAWQQSWQPPTATSSSMVPSTTKQTTTGKQPLDFTQPCKFLMRQGRCARGKRCRFVHNSAPSRTGDASCSQPSPCGFPPSRIGRGRGFSGHSRNDTLEELRGKSGDFGISPERGPCVYPRPRVLRLGGASTGWDLRLGHSRAHSHSDTSAFARPSISREIDCMSGATTPRDAEPRQSKRLRSRELESLPSRRIEEGMESDARTDEPRGPKRVKDALTALSVCVSL